MARKFEHHSFGEMSKSIYNTPTPRFSYENGLFKKTNPVLLNNFLKVAHWIEENCPNLNGEFDCRHNTYHWTKLVVENGKPYLEYGSHGWGYDIALSTTETAVITRGSTQLTPYAFDELFFRNDALEEFLSQWQTIKQYVIAKNEMQNNVYSEDFAV
jgi:hypothetical protein